MACCTSSIAGGCIGGLNLPALARYRTAPDNPDAMPRPPGAYCRVLGPVQVTLAGADAPPELLWRKHVALLVYLARSPRRRRTREHLVGLLWSERDEKQARHSLSEALRVFRRVLGDDQVAALRVADDLTGVLADQVGTAPAPETARLIERIREARLGRRVAAAPAAAAARPRPPLCGRAAELAALVAAWERAKSGRGQIVLVEGEPGEGKSRLIEELVARARLDDATVAVARAVAPDQEKEGSAGAGLLAAGLGDAPGLAGAPAGAPAAPGPLDPEVGARFVGPAPALLLADAVRAAVIAAAQERPTLLALDDAQWIDGATLETLPALTRDTARRPVLLAFGLARGAPGDRRFEALRASIGRDLEGEVIRLGRLDGTALGALVSWALPAYGPADVARLVRRLERDTAGIPLLAVAVLEAVAGGHKLAPEAPAWPSPKRTLVDSLPNDLPPAVVGVVCMRFRQLPAAAQQVLGAAAALGERVDTAQLTTATRLDRIAVEQSLDLLEWERWLAADARGYVFTATIVRSILLQEMVTPGQAKRYRENRST